MSVSSSPRVVGYVRSATVNQDRGGIEHQKAFLGKPSFGRIGLDPLPPATRFYEDEGVSGYGPWEERPGLRDLIRDAGRGKFDVVRVAAVTRLSRSRVDQADIIAALEEPGVRVHADDLDRESPFGGPLFGMLVEAARLERQFLEERIARVQQREA